MKYITIIKEGGGTVRRYLYMAVFVFAFVMLFSTTQASANTVTDSNVSAKAYGAESEQESGILDLEIIKITAGLTKKQEVTFDKVRNISGEAKEGTSLVFYVYQDEKEKEKEQKESYSQSVGASGLFSQLINLKEGKNYIEIVVKQQDKKDTFIFQIDRKKEEIKKELEDVKINNILSSGAGASKDKVLESLLK